MGVPFIGTVRSVEGLVLVIDMRRIVECLHRVMPELVAEHPHGS
jgi:hypothetical protein